MDYNMVCFFNFDLKKGEEIYFDEDETTYTLVGDIELLPEYYPSSVFERLSKALELSYKNIILKKNHFNRTMITERDIKKISKFIKQKTND